MNINLTLFGQMAAFVCFVVFCMKYVWPPVIAAMSDRQKKIADGLAAASKASEDLVTAKQDAEKYIQEAKLEASAIVEAANKRASQVLEEAKQAALVEAERLKEMANAEIAQERQRAREQLRGELTSLTLRGAEKVLGAEIDQKNHERLIAELAQSL